MNFSFNASNVSMLYFDSCDLQTEQLHLMYEAQVNQYLFFGVLAGFLLGVIALGLLILYLNSLKR